MRTALSSRHVQTLLLALVAIGCHWMLECTAGQVEHNGTQSDTICHGHRCYPRVFVATQEFQPVEDDQLLPAGRIEILAHVR